MMEKPAEPLTSASLLARLGGRPGDGAAWEEFVARYSPKVFLWCRHWGQGYRTISTLIP